MLVVLEKSINFVPFATEQSLVARRTMSTTR